MQVMVKAEGGSLAMAAVRADDRVDLGMLNELASQGTENGPKYCLAAEADFATTFEHVEIGA
jgi:hypothetical protein